jgi:hypothetical protein
MVWPIIGAESYVWEKGKSMKVIRLAASWKDYWRKIAIALPDRGSGEQTAQAGENAWFHQQPKKKKGPHDSRPSRFCGLTAF